MEWFEKVLPVIVAVVASSGFWALIQALFSRRSASTRMIIGLGHDRIMALGMKYIERGWITQDEYENLHDWLYEPYEKMGGNGSAKRIMEEVKKLPVRKASYVPEGGEHK